MQYNITPVLDEYLVNVRKLTVLLNHQSPHNIESSNVLTLMSSSNRVSARWQLNPEPFLILVKNAATVQTQVISRLHTLSV
jgi:hypothetical protein